MDPIQTNEEHQLTKKERRMLRREERNAQQERRGKSKAMKRFSMWAVIIVLLGGAVYGIAALIANAPAPATSDDATSLLKVVDGVDHVKGLATSSVTLIEYSDFQCPACGTYYPFIKRLMDEYGDRITFAYRHFPLPQHQHAKLAAYMAGAAGVQGKFWEMHDKLFDNQSKWTPLGNTRDEFFQYAKELGLDMVRFESDVDSSFVKDKVNLDLQSAITLGVNSTPTFFLSGLKLQSPRNYDEFKLYIDNAIAENS